MNIKKHYKIFISVIIIIVLVSSFIIYDITTKNNINYNNNGEHINVKYYNNPDSMPYIPENYTASSNYIINNKVSYINSTIINPCYFDCVNVLHFGLNIHLKNVNNKYICIYTGKLGVTPFYSNIKNGSLIKCIRINNNYETKMKIDSNNITIGNISISPYYTGINHYVPIKIALNNHLYNLFDIFIIKETAIYGNVGLTPGCIVHINGKSYNYDPYLNSSFFIENNNTHNFHIVDIRNGYFYFFAKPYTEYKLYYLNKGNNTLEKFKLNNGKSVNSIETGSAGSSTPAPLYE